MKALTSSDSETVSLHGCSASCSFQSKKQQCSLLWWRERAETWLYITLLSLVRAAEQSPCEECRHYSEPCGPQDACVAANELRAENWKCVRWTGSCASFAFLRPWQRTSALNQKGHTAAFLWKRAPSTLPITITMPKKGNARHINTAGLLLLLMVFWFVAVKVL